MGYSGAWKTRAYQPHDLQGTVPDVDHRRPTDHDRNRNWQNAPEQPPLAPTEIVDHTGYALDAAPGGLVFNPAPHDQGVGYGAGLSFNESRAENESARNTDDGSIAWRKHEPPAWFDGFYHVDRMVNPLNNDEGLRPAGTPDIPSSPGMSQGLNRAEYPNRRQGHYITRWRDRIFERRNWGVEFRPIVTPNAYTAPVQEANADRNQYVSPFGASQNANVRLVQSVAPQLRRSPTPWDESITTDGTEQNVSAIPSYNFASF